MLSPRGVLLLSVPLAADDIDKSHEFPILSGATNTRPHEGSETTHRSEENAALPTENALSAADMCIKVEDALDDLALDTPLLPVDTPRVIV